eukprot:scaffold19380_cov107-Isochrysis_galbana.AAC.7
MPPLSKPAPGPSTKSVPADPWATGAGSRHRRRIGYRSTALRQGEGKGEGVNRRAASMGGKGGRGQR